MFYSKTIGYFFIFIFNEQDLEDPKYERNELLADLKNRWTQIKQKWNEQSKIYEDKKYGLNMEILEELYKK